MFSLIIGVLVFTFGLFVGSLLPVLSAPGVKSLTGRKSKSSTEAAKSRSRLDAAIERMRRPGEWCFEPKDKEYLDNAVLHGTEVDIVYVSTPDEMKSMNPSSEELLSELFSSYAGFSKFSPSEKEQLLSAYFDHTAQEVRDYLSTAHGLSQVTADARKKHNLQLTEYRDLLSTATATGSWDAEFKAVEQRAKGRCR